jgi:nanoRNase/pAp phosphatase (c-di-AMP/oligoRNAs hydrolase)
MTDRLVVGSGPLARSLVESLDGRGERVSLLTNDDATAERARQAGLAVTLADPTAGALADVDGVTALLVAESDPERALAIARAAREAHPGVLVVAYAGAEPPAELASVADRVVDAAQATADAVLARVGERGVRLRRLRQVLRGIDRLAVVTHDNPDPDAIAAAIALARVASATGCEPTIYYYGDITHQENRAFVNLLEFDLVNAEDGVTPEADGYALVDHSRPGVNDGLPEDLAVDIVIDHHPPRAPIEARYVDLRSDVGATSTLMVEYLDHFGVGFDADVATGLLFGIRVDTDEFTREVSPADFEAAAQLLEHADLGTLERIEAPSISLETFDTIGAAIRNRERKGEVLLTYVGRLSDRDALAQAADRLVELHGVSIVLVYGVRDGTIYASARARGTDVDLGEVLRDAFGQIGSAGGHADMAGAQITLGVLEAVDDREESLHDIVETVVSNRFFESLEANTSRPIPGVVAQPGVVDDYLLAEEDRPAGTEEP